MTSDDARIEAALRRLAADEAPLGDGFRARLLADAAAAAPPPRRLRWRWRMPELIGAAGLPAAMLAGLWLGLANPALLDGALPWASAAGDDALLADVLGLGWELTEGAAE